MKALNTVFLALVFSLFFVSSLVHGEESDSQSQEKAEPIVEETGRVDDEAPVPKGIREMRERTNAYLEDRSRDPSFKEVSLAIRPGFLSSIDQPAGVDADGFLLGAEVFFFFKPPFGLYVPYTYERLDSDTENHVVGGGPTIRFLDWKFIRSEVNAAALYARALGGNRFGFRFGGDVTFGSRSAALRPFFGPFVTYEKIYVPGEDFTSLMIGATITLTRFTDLD